MSAAPGKAPRVGVISLGCAKNLVDTEVMLGHLDRGGASFVRDPAEADVLVVNTCGFIEAAREESVQAILEAAQFKKTGRLKRLVVAGCMVQRYAEEMRAELPEVDEFLGLDQLAEVVPAALGPRLGAAPPSAVAIRSDLPLVAASPPPPSVSAAWGPATYLYDHTSPRRLATPRWSAYVKIAEGCDHTCAFCAIPSFRGAFRSRQPDSIVREAEALAAAGVREINLVAQDSSRFGADLGLRDGLARLLERLDRIDSLRWIRVHYLYPNTVTEELIRAMASLPRAVPYVDLPLQHAHPAALKRMRRGGSAGDHLEMLRRFRRVMPEATIRSTFIVGFPGETEAEFEALLEFVRDASFDHVGAFTYSHETSTPAYVLADDVPQAVKEARRERLLDLQQGIALERMRRLVGRRVEVVVEGPHPDTEHLLVGRMSTQAPDVDGKVILNDGVAPPGAFVRVELTEMAGAELVGRILDGLE